MSQFIRLTSVACALALGTIQIASAADAICIGSFQDTSYASIAGLARYRIVCDNGSDGSVQKAWTYSSSAYKSFDQSKILPLAEKLGVSRIRTRENNNFGSYDVYRTKGGEVPARIAFLTRSTSKRRGEVTESITLNEAGKQTTFPAVKIASTEDLTNVDKIAAQEGLDRSSGVEPNYDAGYQIFILYR